MKVYIPRPVAKAAMDDLEAAGYTLVLGSAQDEATMIREIADCDALLIRMDRVTPAVIDAAPKLKVISRHGVGLDNIDVDYATKKGIWVTSAAYANYNAVAEHAVMLMLCCAKRIKFMRGHSTEAEFARAQADAGSELAGKTLGLIGLGKVGLRTAQIAHFGFGMNIVAYDPYISKEYPESWISMKSDRKEIFSLSDIVSLHMPLTAETRRGIGREEICLMKHDAYLINTAREELVDRDSLYQALVEKKIAGTAIDYVENEQDVYQENRLLLLPNVYVTPHSAALTKEAMLKMGLQAAQGIKEVLSGQRPTWPVNEPKRL